MRCVILSVLVLSGMVSGMLVRAAGAADCTRVTFEFVSESHWRATAWDENGALCGVADAVYRIDAAALARRDCGC